MSTKSVASSAAQERTRLRKVADPVQRAREAGELLEALQRAVASTARLRVEAWRELQAEYDWSMGQIAAEYGLSRQRVHQLMRGAA